MSNSVLDVAPSKRLIYMGEWRSRPERAIYLLDQALARAGIDYFATFDELQDTPCFVVHVRAGDAERSRAVIQQIAGRPKN